MPHSRLAIRAAAALAVFAAFAFALPFRWEGCFWPGLAAGASSIALALAFEIGGRSAQTVSWAWKHAALQALVGMFEMALYMAPAWVGALANFGILALFGTIWASAAEKEKEKGKGAGARPAR